MDEINFKSLEKLIIELKDGVFKVKDGSLPSEDFNKLLEASRLLHERLAILQYLTEKSRLSTNKTIDTENLIEKNQINLLDAIVEEEVKSDKDNSIKEDLENKSINELHSQTPQTSLADHFGQQPINDLTKEIGINERFLLTENLFNGDTKAYNDAIDNLNNFSNSEDALKYFRQDLAKNLNWNLKTTQVKRFIKLVERRYNN
tara:strand:- start:1187 stop:1795 length:609 start_codon:yes stop_codon:yes gene_type:complete